VLTGRAISVPFPARRFRFATVSHGHSRSSDLRTLYYRCAAARMVRMGSLSGPLGPHQGYIQPRMSWSQQTMVTSGPSPASPVHFPARRNSSTPRQSNIT
jgi:hypothetical protein